TDTGGFYPGLATVTSHLNGQYVKISDTCGAISKASDWTGFLDFGTSSGTDCATPGPGQGGNTHSARTQFYHVNRIKEAGRSWLPSNTWLQGKLTVHVNLNQTCNAYWDDIGGTLNFFRSGGGCNNTGEIAAVALHEYGHGLDQNDGNGFSPDNGTGETYGDFTAALMTHSSCIGPGFRTTNCGGYGDSCTACTGVRDIDYAKHSAASPRRPLRPRRALRVVRLLGGAVGLRRPRPAEPGERRSMDDHRAALVSLAADRDRRLHLHAVRNLDLGRLLHRLAVAHPARRGRRRRQPDQRH